MNKKLKAIITALLITAVVCAIIPAVSAHDLTWSAVGMDGIAPAIDGIKEDLWSSANSIDVKAWGGEEGAWTNVSVLYDSDYIYFFAKVYDKAIDVSAADPGDGSSRDCVGFLMDFDYVRAAETYFHNTDTAYTGNAGYINIGADSNAYFKGNFDNDAFKNKTTYKVVLTNDGYDVEIAFPLLYKGEKMGVEFFVNDAIGEGARFTFANWHKDGVDSWQRTDTMGTIIFDAVSIVEVEEVAAVIEPVENVTAPVTQTVVTAPATGDSAFTLIVILSLSCMGILLFKKTKKI